MSSALPLYVVFAATCCLWL